MQATEINNEAFSGTLTEFLVNLTQRFPERAGIKEAGLMNSLFNDPASMAAKRSSWAEFSLPILQAIMDGDRAAVLRSIDAEAAKNPLLQRMAIGAIMHDDLVDTNTKEQIWKYVQVLTVLAHRGTGVVIPEPKVAAPAAAPAAAPGAALAPTPAAAPAAAPSAVPAPAPAAAPAAAPTGQDFAKLAEGFIDSMPKVMEAFNKVMEKDGGNNPVAQMLKQFMNPNQLQPGVLNNLAANAMQSGLDANVMGAVQQQMNDLSAADILAKLQKLDRLEKAHARRKRGGN